MDNHKIKHLIRGSRWLTGWSLLLVLAFTVSSCSGLAGTAATKNTATTLPPTDTSIPMVTNTPLPPTETYTPTPTLTPSDTPTPSATDTPTLPPPTPAGDEAIHIYLVQKETGGVVACGDSLIKVNTGKRRSGDIGLDIASALKSLFVKRQWVAGLYNAVWLSNFQVVNVLFDGNSAVVNLTGSYVRSGDYCDDLRVRAQIWTTVRQFGGVKGVTVYLDGNLLGDVLASKDKKKEKPAKTKMP